MANNLKKHLPRLGLNELGKILNENTFEIINTLESEPSKNFFFLILLK